MDRVAARWPDCAARPAGPRVRRTLCLVRGRRGRRRGPEDLRARHPRRLLLLRRRVLDPTRSGDPACAPRRGRARPRSARLSRGPTGRGARPRRRRGQLQPVHRPGRAGLGHGALPRDPGAAPRRRCLALREGGRADPEDARGNRAQRSRRLAVDLREGRAGAAPDPDLRVPVAAAERAAEERRPGSLPGRHRAGEPALRGRPRHRARGFRAGPRVGSDDRHRVCPLPRPLYAGRPVRRAGAALR